MATEGKPRDLTLWGVLIGAALVALFVLPAFTKSPLEGRPAPSAVVAPLLNAPAESPGIPLEGTPGTVTLLDFWASWCPSCRAITPTLTRLHKRYAERGLAIIGVQVDEAPEVGLHYARTEKIPYLIGTDTTGAATAAYGVRQLPTTVLIGKDGTVLRVMTGAVGEEALAELIEGALNAHAPLGTLEPPEAGPSEPSKPRL